MHTDIIDLLQSGDHSALKIVFTRWHKKVYAYFYNKTRNEEAAKDLTQATFLKLWEGREKLSKEYSIEVQLFNKARFIYIDWLRKSAHERRLFNNDELSSEIPMDNSVYMNFDLNQTLNTAINSLPEMRRKVFKLKHIEGYSYREIAEMLGISTKTVDNHLLQAGRQMKKLISSLFLIILLLV